METSILKSADLSHNPPYKNMQKECALLLKKHALGCKVKITIRKEGRVRGHVKTNGFCRSIGIKGLPGYLPIQEANKISTMLEDSYLKFQGDCVEVKPRGRGGVNPSEEDPIIPRYLLEEETKPLDPIKSNRFCELAKDYASVSNYVGAIKYYEKSLRFTAEIEIYANYAALLKQANYLVKAGIAHIYLARVYKRNEMPVEAKNAYEKAVELLPTHREYAEEFATYLEEIGKQKEAVHWYERVADLEGYSDSDKVKYWKKLTDLYSNNDGYAEKLRDLKKKLGPTSPREVVEEIDQALNQRDKRIQDAMNLEHCLSNYEKALKKDPGSIDDARKNLIQIAFTEGMTNPYAFTQAMNALIRSLEEDPCDTGTANSLIQTYQRLGEEINKQIVKTHTLRNTLTLEKLTLAFDLTLKGINICYSNGSINRGKIEKESTFKIVKDAVASIKVDDLNIRYSILSIIEGIHCLEIDNPSTMTAVKEVTNSLIKIGATLSNTLAIKAPGAIGQLIDVYSNCQAGNFWYAAAKGAQASVSIGTTICNTGYEVFTAINKITENLKASKDWYRQSLCIWALIKSSRNKEVEYFLNDCVLRYIEGKDPLTNWEWLYEKINILENLINHTQKDELQERFLNVLIDYFHRYKELPTEIQTKLLLIARKLQKNELFQERIEKDLSLLEQNKALKKQAKFSLALIEQNEKCATYWAEIKTQRKNKKVKIRPAICKYDPPLASFTGRKELLKDIKEAFRGKIRDKTTSVVLSGLPGVGKTQLATEFIKEYAHHYKLVWTFNAESNGTLWESYRGLAQALNLKLRLEILFRAEEILKINEWLQKNPGWLLYFENVKDSKSLEQNLPKNGGQVLVTTRQCKHWQESTVISIGEFQKKESIDLLEKLIPEHKRNRTSIEKLAEVLGDMPLALSQVGSYIKDNEAGLTSSDYLNHFSKERLTMWQNEKPSSGYSKTVANVWKETLDNIKISFPDSAEILGICSYLNSSRINSDWLKNWYMEKNQLPQNFALIQKFNEVMQPLMNFSLLSWEKDQKSIRINSLLQLIIRDNLKKEQQQVLFEALNLVQRQFDDYNFNDSKTWENAEEIFPHAKSVTNHALMFEKQCQSNEKALSNITAIFEQMGKYAHQQEMIQESEQYFQEAQRLKRNQEILPLTDNLPAPILLKQDLSEKVISNQDLTKLSESNLSSEDQINSLLNAIPDPTTRNNKKVKIRPAICKYDPPLASFTGRKELLKDIKEAFRSKIRDKTTSVVLSGLPGVGKTQLATEFIKEYAHHYKLVWTFNAESNGTLWESYRGLAQALNLKLRSEILFRAEEILKINEWLQKNPRWLLYFENVQDPKSLEQNLPQNGGQVLITTRQCKHWKESTVISLEEFQKKESIDLLEKLIPEHKRDRKSIEKLAEVLGHMPLALSQVGSYIKDNECGLTSSDYLNHFSKERLTMWPSEKPSSGYSKTVANVWKETLDNIKISFPDSAEILGICSYLNSSRINSDWLKNWYMEKNQLPQNFALIQKFNEVMQPLMNFSLLSWEKDQKSIQINSLLQLIIRDNLKKEQQQVLFEALNLVQRQFDDYNFNDSKTWENAEEIFPHAKSVTNHALMFEKQCQSNEKALSNITAIFEQMGKYAHQQEMIQESEQYFQEAQRLKRNQEILPLADNLPTPILLKQDLSEKVISNQDLTKLSESNLSSEDQINSLLNAIPDPTTRNIVLNAIETLCKNDPTQKELNLFFMHIGNEGTWALARALEKNHTIQQLNLGANQISVKGSRALAKVLEKNQTIQQLNLCNSQIGDEGARVLARTLEKNRSLQQLNLYDSQIGDEGALALAKALEKNQTIQQLDLNTNQISTKGSQALANALEKNQSLQQLNLYYNRIGVAGAQALASALKKNHSLQQLKLQRNEIGDEGARALASALEKNHSLQQLELQQNEIGDEGARALAKALEKNQSLQQLELQRNEIGPMGALALAKAIESNPLLPIQVMGFYGNTREKAAVALQQVIANRSKVPPSPNQIPQHQTTEDQIGSLLNTIPDPTTRNIVRNAVERLLKNEAETLEIKDKSIGIIGAKALAFALEQNQHIKSLRLINNEIGLEGTKALATALEKNLTLPLEELCLAKNEIGDEGAKALAIALKENHTLQKLILWSNQIGNDGTTALASTLKTNDSLQALDLTFNVIQDQGGRMLEIALETNQSLKKLYLFGNKIHRNLLAQIKALLTQRPTALPANNEAEFTDSQSYEFFRMDCDALINEISNATEKKVVRNAIKTLLKKNQTQKTLNLSAKNICDEGVTALALAIEKNPQMPLQQLNLSFNQIGNKGAKALALAIEKNPQISLQNLDLTANEIGNTGIAALAKMLKTNQSLTSLHLMGCQIEDLGAKKLAEALKKNTALQTLDLSHNNIRPEGGKELAEALKKNRTLRSLDLDHSNILLPGITALKNVLARSHNTSLLTLSIEGNTISQNFPELKAEIKKYLIRNKRLFRRIYGEK